MGSKSKSVRAGKSCPDFSIELSAYFDGELEGAGKAAIEGHLAQCEACRKRLAGMNQLRQALTGLAKPGEQRGRSVLDMVRAKLAEADATPEKKPLVS